MANSARGLTPPSGTSRPATIACSGPKTRTSISPVPGVTLPPRRQTTQAAAFSAFTDLGTDALPGTVRLHRMRSPPPKGHDHESRCGLSQPAPDASADRTPRHRPPLHAVLTTITHLRRRSLMRFVDNRRTVATIVVASYLALPASAS